MEHVTTVSNSNASCFRVVLSRVELRWVLTTREQCEKVGQVQTDKDEEVRMDVVRSGLHSIHKNIGTFS